MGKAGGRAKRRGEEHFTLEVPQFVTMPQVHRLVDRAQPIIQGTGQFRTLTIDTRELRLISPVGLATFASILLIAARKDRFQEGFFLRPRREHVRTYLSRMNFHSVVGVRERRLERPHRSPRRGRFRELVEVSTADECDRVTVQLRGVLARSAGLGDVILDNVSYCLAEVLENVIQHAESPTNGVACAQAYPGSHAVELAIIDSGIGVRGSLSKNPQYADLIRSDEDAVRLALQRGVTSNPGRNSGEGLFFVRELLSRSGKMILQSGDVVLTVGRRGETVRKAPWWPGTMVGLRLELRQGVRMRDIFDKYSPIEETFGPFQLEMPIVEGA